MIPEELKKRRAKLGLSQAQLALALRRPVDTIQNWEQGRRAIESPDVLRYLLRNLDDDRVAFGADREGFLAYLPRFLDSEGPRR